MATPPTFILDNEGTAGWDDTTANRATAAFSSAVGDVWVTCLACDVETSTFGTPTNGGTAQAYTLRGNIDQTDYCEVRAWSTVVANTLTSQTVTNSRTSGTANRWNMNVVRFSGSGGVGAVPAGEAETSGTAPSLTFTTSADNSAIVVIVADWNAADGASRTWRTVNSITPTAGNGFELTYFRNASQYTVYVAYYPDAGAAGSKTVGLSAPNMKASIVAVEVLGTGGTNATVSATTVAAVAAQPAPAKQTGSTIAATAIARAVALPAPAKQAGSTIAATSIATAAALPAPTVSGGAIVTATTAAATATLPPPAISTGSTVAANAIITTIALPPPTVSAAAVVAATAVATSTALPAPSISTSSTVAAITAAAVAALPAPVVETAGNATVTAVTVAATTALPAPSVSTDVAATFVRHVTVAAPRNGTADHTVHPDGTGGSVVDGSAFTPVSGRLLVCVVEGPVTSSTATGWTLPSNGSAILNTGLYVFYRTASGTSADQFATSHNNSDRPVAFDFYEFHTGSTFVASVAETDVNPSGGAGPILAGLTPVNWTAGVMGQTNAGAGTESVTWNLGTEEVDTSVVASGTNGYTYSLTYIVGDTRTDPVYQATSTNTGVNVERLVFAVNASSTGDATVAAVTIVTSTALPAPTIVNPDATVAAVAVAAVTAMPAPAVQTPGNATVAAVTVTAVAGMPAPAVAVGVTVTPVAVAAVAELPGVEQADATIAPDTVAAVAAVGVPSVQTAGNATVAASSIAATAALPAPTVVTSVNATVAASSIATVTSLPAPVVSAGATVTATSIVAVTALPQPAIQTAGNVTIPATTVATVTSLPAPSLQTGSRVNPTTLATVTSITAPTVSGNATVAPATIATVAALPPPSVRTGSTVTPGTLATVTALPKPTASGNVVQSLAARSSTGPRLFRSSTAHQLFRSSAHLG